MWAEKHTKPSGLIFDQYFCSKCRRGTYIDKDELEKGVAKVFRRIEISQSYVDMVLEKAKSILKETRTNEESEKRRLQADKSKLEKAMHETEDSRFVTHSLTEDVFQRIYGRYQTQLNSINQEFEKIGKDHSKKIAALEEILKLAENIGEAYEGADFIQKRSYLGLFFKHFKIKKGKVVNFALSDELKPLIENGSVRVRHNGLPAPKLSIQESFDEILKVFENVSYIGELRQRWVEIKKLLKGGLSDVNAIPVAMRAIFTKSAF